MRFFRIAVLTSLCLAGPGAGLSAQEHAHHQPTRATGVADTTVATPLVSQTIIHNGVSVALTLGRPSAGTEGSILAGDDVSVRIALTDSGDGTPLTDLLPAGWIDARDGTGITERAACRDKIQSYLRGTLQIRPAIDLNSSYVLALTAGNAVAVYDPIVGFNISKLYAAAPLRSAGEDWALAPDEDRLFVTTPTLNEIAVVSTNTWRVEAVVTVGLRPKRIAFQPDGRYLWVANEGVGGAASGVSVIDPVTLAVVQHIPTGEGSHELAFTPDSRFVFVSNSEAGTVSIIDIAELAATKQIETGPLPVGLAYSEVGQAVYITHEGDGSVVIVDAGSHEVTARLPTKPGVSAVAFDPSGRWGFAVNPKEDEVYIFDASTGIVTDTLPFGQAPDQVVFTENFAYVRASGSPDVVMISLEVLADEGKARIMPFETGRVAPVKYGSRATATAIAPASHHMSDAVYVPNAAEKSIYLYHYMMSMPMPAGRVDTYPFEPTATLVVSRALREAAPGVYVTTFKAPPAGAWDVVFLLDDPRVIHCFDFEVSVNPTIETVKPPRIRIERLDAEERLSAGETAEVRFKLVDQDTGEPQVGLADVWVWVFSSRGWSTRRVAEHVEDGIYQIELTLPTPGTYQMITASRTLNVRFEDSFPAFVRAAAKPEKSNDPP